MYLNSAINVNSNKNKPNNLVRSTLHSKHSLFSCYKHIYINGQSNFLLKALNFLKESVKSIRLHKLYSTVYIKRVLKTLLKSCSTAYKISNYFHFCIDYALLHISVDIFLFLKIFPLSLIFFFVFVKSIFKSSLKDQCCFGILITRVRCVHAIYRSLDV